jgi:hypothetical protein
MRQQGNLHRVSGKADYTTLSDVSIIDSDPNLEGIKRIIDSVPHEEIWLEQLRSLLHIISIPIIPHLICG